MPTPTKRVVFVLAVFALIVASVNIYRWFSPPQPQSTLFSQTIPTPLPSIEIIPTPTDQTFTSRMCGIQISYPLGFSKNEDASGSALLASPDNKNAIIVTCNKDEKLPVVSKKDRETVEIASISATLYHREFDGVKLETLVITHPKTGVNIFVAGAGQDFNDSIKTIKIL